MTELPENEVGISERDLPEVTKYLNPVTAAMGCGLGADVISAYLAYNFIQPGVVGYYRYQNGGLDPTDEIYLASFPGGHAAVCTWGRSCAAGCGKYAAKSHAPAHGFR